MKWVKLIKSFDYGYWSNFLKNDSNKRKDFLKNLYDEVKREKIYNNSTKEQTKEYLKRSWGDELIDLMEEYNLLDDILNKVYSEETNLKINQDLYHLVGIHEMEYIYNNDEFRGQNYPHVSFTTNKNMSDYIGSRFPLFRIIIDGKKLSNDVELEYFQFKSQTNITFNENEVRTLNRYLPNASKYIKGIEFLLNNYNKNFKDTDHVYGMSKNKFKKFLNLLNNKYGIINYNNVKI